MEYKGTPLGTFEPAGEYIPKHVIEIADALFDADMHTEAHEILGASLEWAKTHKYYARLIGYAAVEAPGSSNE